MSGNTYAEVGGQEARDKGEGCLHSLTGGAKRRPPVGRGSYIQRAKYETGSALGSWEGTEQDRSVS